MKPTLTYFEARFMGAFIVAGVMSKTGDPPRDPVRTFDHFDFLRERIGIRAYRQAMNGLQDKHLISPVIELLGRPIGLKCENEAIAIDCYDAVCSGYKSELFEWDESWPKIMYRVAWKSGPLQNPRGSSATGHSGHSEWTKDEKAVDREIARENKNWPDDIYCWKEEKTVEL